MTESYSPLFAFRDFLKIDKKTSRRLFVFMVGFSKHAPGVVRDTIMEILRSAPAGKSVSAIISEVNQSLGATAPSSVRSYLRLNTPQHFHRVGRGYYALKTPTRINDETTPLLPLSNRASSSVAKFPRKRIGRAEIFQADCFDWLERRDPQSVHAVVTDPPYGLIEYSEREQSKLRAGHGGVWRIPPSFDGHRRAPLPRFTVLTAADINALDHFFYRWGRATMRVLVPGAQVIVASNPLLSHVVSGALARAGLERRGEIARLTMTMRGGDRPKAAHEEFSGVSVMPRSRWEPWLLFRNPLEGRVQDNLRKWKTGGFRRVSDEKPFSDVIESSPTRPNERALAPHPSLKPQSFLRQVVRAVLPLEIGIVLDPFAGSGSTLAAAEAVGYESIGIERDPEYFTLAAESIPRLAKLRV